MSTFTCTCTCIYKSQDGLMLISVYNKFLVDRQMVIMYVWPWNSVVKEWYTISKLVEREVKSTTCIYESLLLSMHIVSNANYKCTSQRGEICNVKSNHSVSLQIKALLPFIAESQIYSIPWMFREMVHMQPRPVYRAKSCRRISVLAKK